MIPKNEGKMSKIPRNLYAFLLICIAIPVFLTGCSSSGESFEALMERLEFDCGETGEVSLSTSLDITPGPFGNSNTTLIYNKKKTEADFGCSVDE